MDKPIADVIVELDEYLLGEAQRQGAETPFVHAFRKTIKMHDDEAQMLHLLGESGNRWTHPYMVTLERVETLDRVLRLFHTAATQAMPALTEPDDRFDENGNLVRCVCGAELKAAELFWLDISKVCPQCAREYS